MPDAGPASDVVYCEGWDPVSRSASGVMPEAAARARDLAGAQYAVLLLAAARPLALIHVAWAAGYLGVYEFDGAARRITEFDFRVLDDPDRLYWRGCRHWRHGSARDTEFSDEAGQLDLSIDQEGRAILEFREPGGGMRVTRPRLPEGLRAISRAPFGSWWSYARAGRPEVAGVPAEGGTGDSPVPGLRSADAEPGWKPPAPLAPRNIEALFIAGTRLRSAPDEDGDGLIAVVREPYDAGVIRLPSGLVLAGDPFSADVFSREAFTASVPPGDYPVSIAWVSGEAGETVTAVRLLIGDERAVTWEMALMPGQDPRMLPDGGYLGFGVDGGIGAFLDASGRQVLPASLQDRFGVRDPFPDTAAPAGYAMWTEDQASGTNMLVYPSGIGDGEYPVWVGRDADAQVVMLIADMLLFSDGELLSPAAASTARYVLADVTPRPGAQAPAALPADIGRFLDEIVADATGQTDAAARESAQASAAIGRALLAAGHYQQALGILARAIDLGAGSARTIALRGEAYRMMEQYDQALADFSRAVDLDPGDAWAAGVRGKAYLELGRHDEALADFSHAIELGADEDWIMASRGETHLAMGRHEEARADFARATELDPGYIPPQGPGSEPDSA